MSSVSRDRNRFLTRTFGAAGVVLFVSAFFVAPLANAWMLCTMTCCHHSAMATVAATPATPCGTGECTISAPDVTIPVASNVSQNSPVSIINVDVRATVGSAPATHVELQPDTSPHGVHAPIHVLNSTFRI